MNKRAVVLDAAVAEQVREQSQGVVGQRLIDEGLLALQRSQSATAWLFLVVQFRLDDLG